MREAAALLAGAGYDVTAEPDQADLLIVNTCSIRDKAERRRRMDLSANRASGPADATVTVVE